MTKFENQMLAELLRMKRDELKETLDTDPKPDSKIDEINIDIANNALESFKMLDKHLDHINRVIDKYLQ